MSATVTITIPAEDAATLRELACDDYALFTAEAAEAKGAEDWLEYQEWAADAGGVLDMLSETFHADSVVEVERPQTWISGLMAAAETALTEMDTDWLMSCTRLLDRFLAAEAATT